MTFVSMSSLYVQILSQLLREAHGCWVLVLEVCMSNEQNYSLKLLFLMTIPDLPNES